MSFSHVPHLIELRSVDSLRPDMHLPINLGGCAQNWGYPFPLCKGVPEFLAGMRILDEDPSSFKDEPISHVP